MAENPRGLADRGTRCLTCFMKKNAPFRVRFGFACNGLRSTFAREASFRFQIYCAGLLTVVLGFVQPSAWWWALFILCGTAVLALELLNTALESALDRLHPDLDPAIAIAKDCAAAAVLITSVASVLVFICFLFGGSSKLHSVIQQMLLENL